MHRVKKLRDEHYISTSTILCQEHTATVVNYSAHT